MVETVEDVPSVSEVRTIMRSNYCDTLIRVLNDLDRNGLTDLVLLNDYDNITLVARAVARGTKDGDLLALVFEADDFLSIAIRATRQDGPETKPRRQLVNKLLVKITDGAYKPIYNP